MLLLTLPRDIIPCMLPLLLFWVTASTPDAQQHASVDAQAFLLQAREKILKTFDRLPKYLCTETIDRSTFEPSRAAAGLSCSDITTPKEGLNLAVRKQTSDRLRLDVAVSREGEMYSWAGDDRFGDRSLADLVQSGATSTGTFASFIASIFGTNAASFTYNGDFQASGHSLIDFGFTVPVEKSNYEIGNKLLRAVVGYQGRFWIDAKDFTLARLSIQANQLPPALNTCESNTTIDYRNIRLNNSDVLIPKEVHWRVVDVDGSEFRSQTVFSACHEFHGESTLLFDLPPESIPAATQAHTFELPPDIPFSVELTKSIDTQTTAAGDLFAAKLSNPIRKGRQTLVPRGAAVAGRIIRIEHMYGTDNFASLEVAVKLNTVSVNGAPQEFPARLASRFQRHAKRTARSAEGKELGSFDQMFDPGDPAVGTLQFEHVTDGYVIGAGLKIDGRTVGAK